jgi:hypothetical protein
MVATVESEVIEIVATWSTSGGTVAPSFIHEEETDACEDVDADEEELEAENAPVN